MFGNGCFLKRSVFDLIMARSTALLTQRKERGSGALRYSAWEEKLKMLH